MLVTIGNAVRLRRPSLPDENAQSQTDDKLQLSQSHHHEMGQRHTVDTNDDDDDDEVLESMSIDAEHRVLTLRELIQGVVAGYPIGSEPENPVWRYLSNAVTNFVFLVIALSVASFGVSTLPAYYRNGSPVLDDIEIFCTAVFTLELLVRCSTAPSQAAFWTNPLTWIDVLSVLPFYVMLALSGSNGAGALVFFRVLRLIRITRVFKLVKNNIGFEAVFESLVTSKEALSLMGFMIIVAMCTFSAAMYFAELDGCSFDDRTNLWIRPGGEVSPYQSMFHAMWWCIVTITTVGYGDDVPITGGGKFIAAVATICGVFVISFPSAILGANFAEIHSRKIRERDDLLRRSKKVKGAKTALPLPTSIVSPQSQTDRLLAGLTRQQSTLSPQNVGSRVITYMADDDVPPRDILILGSTVRYSPALTMLTQESDPYVLVVREEVLFPPPSRNLVFTLILACQSIHEQVEQSLRTHGLDPAKFEVSPRPIHKLYVTAAMTQGMRDAGIRVTTLEYASPSGQIPLVFHCPDEMAESLLMAEMHQVDLRFRVEYDEPSELLLPLNNYRTAALVRKRTMTLGGHGGAPIRPMKRKASQEPHAVFLEDHDELASEDGTPPPHPLTT